MSAVTTMLLEANSVGFLFWFLLGLGSIAAARVARAASRGSRDGEVR
ncbi:MAG: hypothetical protein LC744_07775 [Chloroflexi bacterium]|nr:hypothetical protein [Chloroflexota bacterium]